MNPSAITLVMPMAGRGSRFAKQGIKEPKPLIPLWGRPFFWWATESVKRRVDVAELVYVVLQEHIDEFHIDEIIHGFYPEARLVVIPDVTAGAAETAWLGIQAVQDSHGVVAINDCDHAFDATGLPQAADQLRSGLDGALMCFNSNSPAYSYAKVDPQGQVQGTVEKVVVSTHAIAGCYLFSSAPRFLEAYEQYKKTCEYDELFISGVFNHMIANGQNVGKVDLADHVSFGTPQEFQLVTAERFAPYTAWTATRP